MPTIKEQFKNKLKHTCDTDTTTTVIKRPNIYIYIYIAEVVFI